MQLAQDEDPKSDASLEPAAPAAMGRGANARDPMPLTPAQVAELHGLLQAPVTAFDCGTLCAPGNGGVPVCCHAPTILPVLYKAELALLRRRTTMWTRHVPQGADAELAQLARPCDVFAVCKGHLQCEREHRDLTCRTFPFEPYLDHRGRLAGLVFCFDLAHLCPLMLGDQRIEPEFLAQCLRMYARLFEFAPEEHAFHLGISRRLRRQFGQRREPIPVFTTAGVVAMPTRRPRRRPPGRTPGRPGDATRTSPATPRGNMPRPRRTPAGS